MKIVDIRTQRSKREAEQMKLPSTPAEKRLQEFAREVDARLKQLEASQKRQDALLNRLIKRIAELLKKKN